VIINVSSLADELPGALECKEDLEAKHECKDPLEDAAIFESLSDYLQRPDRSPCRQVPQHSKSEHIAQSHPYPIQVDRMFAGQCTTKAESPQDRELGLRLLVAKGKEMTRASLLLDTSPNADADADRQDSGCAVPANPPVLHPLPSCKSEQVLEVKGAASEAGQCVFRGVETVGGATQRPASTN